MLKDITQDFSRRHIGPNLAEQQEMLSQLGLKSINALIDKTIPKKIQTKFGLHIGQGLDEFSLLKKIIELLYLPIGTADILPTMILKTKTAQYLEQMMEEVELEF